MSLSRLPLGEIRLPDNHSSESPVSGVVPNSARSSTARECRQMEALYDEIRQKDVIINKLKNFVSKTPIPDEKRVKHLVKERVTLRAMQAKIDSLNSKLDSHRRTVTIAVNELDSLIQLVSQELSR